MLWVLGDRDHAQRSRVVGHQGATWCRLGRRVLQRRARP